ncbi:hypothetical protein DSO57_1002291 [Entomophthora muscae]|uniref:Uncharacterized protein n=1 Tax=Entomophthora muscae TaxID=34485 RepID=A0ACC2TJE7_9FUNG|nr:hypothetical protein DSO57_1002291 [Entomophthora muscae]
MTQDTRWGLATRNPTEIVAHFGRPKRLITDGGPDLVRKVMKVYCTKNTLQQVVTTPYYPVRIDNSLTLETQAKGRDLNPEPKSLRAAKPGDQGLPACISLESTPHKLRPRTMAQMVKQAKPKELSLQMEE